MKDFSELTRKERRSAIVGMVLGDAHLGRNRFRDKSYRGNAFLKLGHSYKQYDYMVYKKNILQTMFQSELNISTRINNKSYKICELATRVNPQLTRLFKLMYDQETKKRRVTREILDLLDDRGMAIWYMDDGCLSKSHCCIVILGTYGFSYEENIIIRDWILEKYGVSFNINKHVSGKYSLRKGISEAYKLIDRIKPYIIPSMMYKADYPTPKRGKWYNLSPQRPAPLAIANG